MESQSCVPRTVASAMPPSCSHRGHPGSDREYHPNPLTRSTCAADLVTGSCSDDGHQRTCICPVLQALSAQAGCLRVASQDTPSPFQISISLRTVPDRNLNLITACSLCPRHPRSTSALSQLSYSHNLSVPAIPRDPVRTL